jgi:hypothetical protein
MKTRGLVLSISVTASVAASVGGCGASGEVKGGELRLPAGTGWEPGVVTDGGIAGASTWASLYADYFGPKGAASCTSSGTCHSSAGQAGARESNFICGSTEATCYDGLLAAGLVPVGGASDPSQVTLRFVIRTAAGGSMPKGSRFVFSESDLARIDGWVRGGAAR